VGKARTLLVDPGETAPQTAAVLEDSGYEVTVAESVSDALVRLRDYRPDAVVTEYELPDGDGSDLLEEVRAADETLPVVVYTARGSEHAASECIDAGVSSYIPNDGARSTEKLVETLNDHVLTGSSGPGTNGLPEPSPGSIIRAIDEAPIGITLSDPSLPDNPMVYVNEGYEEMTGYDATDALGRNCRFLQGPDTEEEPVAEMRRAIDAEEPVTVEVLNYREDGTPFWNRVTIAPIHGTDGAVSNFVGFQEDVTERKEAQARARQRADALREERQTLERVLGRVSGLVNDISHALVSASDREEIERQVCAEIAATDGYSHAWIGTPQAAGARLTVQVSDGTQKIEAETSADVSGTVIEKALTQGTVVVPTAGDEVPPPLSPERAGAAAMAVIPLTYRRATYGVLCVYADRSEVLDRRECEVLDAIGQMVASGINAVETKQVLTADRVTELGFEITDDSFPLIELAVRSEGPVTYDGSTVDEEGSLRVFITMSDTDDFEALVASCPGLVDGFVIARNDGTLAASVELGEDHPFGELAEYGATLRDLSVSGTSGTAQLHIDLPVEGDVRSVLSVLESAYDGVNLVRQREREREPRPTAEFTRAVADRLTDRQYTALETAYLSNYFDFPRPVSGEELATTMDISRQTYHQHLRAAQRKLLEEFFESE
jgi:PAS domain S-box-containing protein